MYKNRYQIPLFLTFLLLLIEFLLMPSKWPDIAGSLMKHIKGLRITALILFFLSVSGVLNAHAGASADARKGNSEYSKENYGKATEHYTTALQASPERSDIMFNLGDSLYRQGDFEKAAEAFSRVSQDKKIGARADFNSGNSAFMSGKYDEASENYRKALIKNPSDGNARKNLQITLLKIKEEKKQSKSDKKQNDKDNKGKDQKKDKSGGGQNESEAERQRKEKEEKSREKQKAERLLEMMKEKEKDASRNFASQLKSGGKKSDESASQDW